MHGSCFICSSLPVGHEDLLVSYHVTSATRRNATYVQVCLQISHLDV